MNQTKKKYKVFVSSDNINSSKIDTGLILEVDDESFIIKELFKIYGFTKHIDYYVPIYNKDSITISYLGKPDWILEKIV